MNTKLAAIALATALSTSSASALELQSVRSGETAPNVFGSTTTYGNANARPTAVTQRQTQRRALNVQIRTVQRQYLNAKRAGDPRAAQLKVELDRLKAQQHELNRIARNVR